MSDNPMFKRLASFETHLDALDRQLMDPAITSDSGRMREVAREATRVRNVVEAYHEHQRLEKELEGA